jgi:HlyD family secretion protein
VLAALGTAAGWAVKKWRGKVVKNASAPQTVYVEKTKKGSLDEVIQASGEVEALNRVQISARVSARIVAIPHPEGEKVTAGDAHTSPSVLVQLDSTDLQAALRSTQARYEAQKDQILSSQASVASAKTQLDRALLAQMDANREMNRESKLFETHNSSQQALDAANLKAEEAKNDVESARLSLQSAEAGLEAAKHNLEAADADIAKAKQSLSDATITSPIDGTVIRVNAKVGEMVITGTMNNAGTVILEVADLSKMLVKVNINEGDMMQVKTGQDATVYMQAYGDKPFKGKVTQVALSSTTADSQNKEKRFEAEILLEGTTLKIPSGLSADADIVTSHHANVLTLPSQAVLGRPIDELPSRIRDQLSRDEKKKSMAPVAFLFEDGKAKMVKVDVGPSDASDTIIEKGLKPGDQVVSGPYKILEKLKDGDSVKLDTDTTGTVTSKTAPPAKKDSDKSGDSKK